MTVWDELEEQSDGYRPATVDKAIARGRKLEAALEMARDGLNQLDHILNWNDDQLSDEPIQAELIEIIELKQKKTK